MSKWFDSLKQAGKGFIADEGLRCAAALSFYTALSLGPIFVLLLWATSFIGADAQEQIVGGVRTILGPRAAAAVPAAEQLAKLTPLKSWPALAGFLGLLFSSTTIFAEFQLTLNRIWNVSDEASESVLDYVKRRMLSVVMLAAFGVAVWLALLVSTLSTLLFDRLGFLLGLGSFVGSALFFSAAFAVLYKTIPDCYVRLEDAAVGGAMTGVLFALGKEAIGVYLGLVGVGSVYGAAGSLLVLLVWVYYSAIVVLFGAELTQVYAEEFGRGLTAKRHQGGETRPSNESSSQKKDDEQ